MAVFFTGSIAWSRTITVKISNIRGDNGMILVMAQSGKESKPVYGMAKTRKRRSHRHTRKRKMGTVRPLSLPR